MKKLVFFVFIIFILFSLFPSNIASSEEVLDDTVEMIPDESIRLRILANSDREEDQRLKALVRDRVNEEINGWVEHLTSIEEARSMIHQKLPVIEEMVADVLEEEGATNDFTVEFRENVTFPVKLYGNYLYPPGEYEAILITIGEGEGSNWWCVLFPPLCFLDFSNGTTAEAHAAEADSEEAFIEEEEEEEEEETEVKFFFLKWLDWF